MLSILEVAERAQRGPKMPVNDWELGLYEKITELVKQYGIKCPDPNDTFFNSDGNLTKAAFEAAQEFLTSMGAYCISTNRVIKFTEDEIKDAIKDSSKEVIMGCGSDVRVFRQRKIEEDSPLGLCSGMHAPFSEDLAPLIVKNFAQIPRTDFIEGFNIAVVDGREIINEVFEAYASMREVAWLKEGVRKAGRPGLAILYYPINTRASTLIAGITELRQGDGVLLSVLPDVKVELGLMTTAMVHEELTGGFRVSGNFALAGGFCGGFEGAIIEAIVKVLVSVLCYHVHIGYVGVEDLRQVSALKTILRPLYWATSVVFQALNQYTNHICMRWSIPTCGVGTHLNLYEHAIRSLEAVVDGGNLYAPRHSRSEINAGQTPLEAEWLVEVSDAIMKSGYNKRSEAAKLLRILVKKVEGKQPLPSKPIHEVYDLVKHKPHREYEEVYKQVKAELADLGLKFK